MSPDDPPRRAGRPAKPLQREDLLATAREAFAQLGYSGASMAEIAARAGIRKSSLFHHFPTKDELYRDAIAAVIADIGLVVQDGASGDGDTLTRIDRSTAALQRYLGKHPVAARLLLREFVDGTAAITAGGDLVDAVLQATVALIDAGMAEGLFPRADARHLALSLIGLHFTFFGTPAVSSRLMGIDAFDASMVEARAVAVVDHVRALLGAPLRR